MKCTNWSLSVRKNAGNRTHVVSFVRYNTLLIKESTTAAAAELRKSDRLLQVVVFSFVGSPLMFLVKCDWDINHVFFIIGNGTIGLEIVEDLPDVDVVICPYGGGGLISGVSSAVKSLRTNAKVYACEVETAAPLKLSLDLGKPSTFNYIASFVDGMGGKSVLDSMWPLVSNLVDDSLVVTLQEVADSVKLLAERNRVVAEGAGAATVAAALSEKFSDRLSGNIVCVISGGNIDTNKLIQALEGKIPQ